MFNIRNKLQYTLHVTASTYSTRGRALDATAGEHWTHPQTQNGRKVDAKRTQSRRKEDASWTHLRAHADAKRTQNARGSDAVFGKLFLGSTVYVKYLSCVSLRLLVMCVIHPSYWSNFCTVNT